MQSQKKGISFYEMVYTITDKQLRVDGEKE